MQEAELRKGPWLEEEDQRLADAIAVLGERRWDALAKASGLKRSGKSCRLRWMNYLRPNLKHGNISAEEERTIVELHEKWGNKWSRIAQRLPGRTDNEIKNYWRTYLRKKNHVLEKATSECGSGSAFSINIECLSVKGDTLGASSDAIEQLSFTRSPYEARLTEWMSNWQSEVPKTESEYKLFNNGLPYPEGIYEDGNTGAWAFSLWDG